MSTKMWEDGFRCDGECGAEVHISTRSSSRRLTRETLESLGWIVISAQEAYCPECHATAEKIAEVTAKNKESISRRKKIGGPGAGGVSKVGGRRRSS